LGIAAMKANKGHQVHVHSPLLLRHICPVGVRWARNGVKGGGGRRQL
jgi:hypothetical protein